GLRPQRVEVHPNPTFSGRFQQATERFEAIAKSRRLDGKIAVERLVPDRPEGQLIACGHGFRIVVRAVPRADRAAPAAPGGPTAPADGSPRGRPRDVAARQLFDDALLQPR